ncbi:MAG: phosphoribosylamine--glycine ligase [Bacteroidia bacterium]|nr:phosphoribosylamine--glycine ligase [Bacteroidia bacterium]
MKILLLGSGGREHAFAMKIAQSPKLTKLYIAPGNAGTAQCGENVNMGVLDFDAIFDFCIQNKIDLVVPGSEDPLVAGIYDYFQEKANNGAPKILVSGPSAFAAQLEGSKDFSKAFMQRHGIPTAGAFTANKDNLEQGLAYLRSLPAPYVLKADGLAAGKGVIITESLAEAEATLSEMILGRTFGAASEKVLIEEFLKGIEISVFAVCDGKNWKMLASAKDYKRIGEGDTGPNTGGMGAISPVPFADEVFLNKVANQVAKPTFEGLAAEGHPFKGFLFIGLMNDNGDPKVIEFNVRMGDPETEAIFPRLKTDMVDLLTAIASDGIETLPIELDNRTAATVFLVSKGYPGTIEKGKKMHIPMVEADCTLFHAGTALNPLNEVVTNGGRVLAITALGNGIEQAKNSAMKMAELIDYEGKTYRTDIGLDLINYQKNQTNG